MGGTMFDVGRPGCHAYWAAAMWRLMGKVVFFSLCWSHRWRIWQWDSCIRAGAVFVLHTNDGLMDEGLVKVNNLLLLVAMP